MEDRTGSGERDDHDGEDDTPRRLNARVAGPALAAGAVSLGLVLIGSCGLREHEDYVTPPPLHADLQPAASGATRTEGITESPVSIPPSPTWRVAEDRTTRSRPPETSTHRPRTPSTPRSAAGSTASGSTTSHPSSYRSSTALPSTGLPSTGLPSTGLPSSAYRPSTAYRTLTPSPTADYGSPWDDDGYH